MTDVPRGQRHHQRPVAGGIRLFNAFQKHVFAVWLALLNKLHLPYLLGGALLWCAAALLAAFALRPLWRKSPAGQARALTLLLYALLAFLPSSWASYTLRVYRDNIFPALCLLFFAGMAGAALRAVFYTRQQAPFGRGCWQRALALPAVT